MHHQRTHYTRLTYAGIGSRRTPDDVLAFMERLAGALAADGWILRSGHAPGADLAFERGAGRACDIFLPWRTFGERDHTPSVTGRAFEQPTKQAYELAAEHHPNWYALTHGGQALQARNCHQVLGYDLASPCKFVACWTPDGSLDGQGHESGGTGQALRLASARGIPVFNLKRDDHKTRLKTYLEKATPSA